jgi:hypothetical protein
MRTNNHQRDEAQQGLPDCVVQTEAGAAKGKEHEIDWKTWWPFERATGDALRQLNKRQPKRNELTDYEEAPL